MKRLIYPPSLILICVSTVSFITPLFTGHSTIDIHLHDTYFIIADQHLYLGAGIALALLSIVFLAVKKIIWSNSVSLLAASMIAAFFLIVIAYTALPSYGPRRYIDYSGWASYRSFQFWLEVSLAAFLISCFIQTVNIVVGFIAKLRS